MIEAVQDSEHFTREFSSDAEAITLAGACAKSGRFAESYAILTHRLEQGPPASGLLYERGLTLFDWGRLREALADFRAAEARGLSSFGLHLNLGYACHLLGYAGEAERHIRRAIALDEGAPVAHLGLGALLQAAKRLDEAIQSFERAYELDPNRWDCLASIASCRIEEKNGPAAEALLRRMISFGAGNQAKHWAMLGVALSLQDRIDEATSAFEQALAQEARDGLAAEAFVMYGVYLIGIGRIKEALDLYARYLPAHPHPRAQTHHAWALLTAGRLREGWAQYEFRWCEEPFL
ncbi:MAG TPA: tetratricopeptide repeat protein, partial [Casimicrobiaceae bacterium]